MTDIYKAIEEYNDLRDAGKNVEYHFGKDVTIGLENGEQTKYETVGEAFQGIGMTLTGIAGGATSATLGLPTDIAGLFVGIKDAVTAEEGKRIDAFVNGFTEFSKANLGSEYYRGIFDNFVDSFDVDPKLKEDAKSGFGAGEFGGVGGAVKVGVTKGPKLVKKGLEKIGDKAQQELDLDTGGATLSSMGAGQMNTALNTHLAKLAKNRNIAPRKVDEMGFYSKALEETKKLKQEKGTGEQFKSMLLKAGVKQDEIDWSGLDEVLSKDKVTKQEIVDQLEANEIELEEVVKTGELEDAELNFSASEQNIRSDDLLIKNVAKDGEPDKDLLKSTLSPEDSYGPEYINNRADEIFEEYERAEDFPFEGYSIDDAYNKALEEYYDNPIRIYQDEKTGFIITGNDDVGYNFFRNRSEANNFRNALRSDGDVPYSLNEAKIQANDIAQEEGIIDDPNDIVGGDVTQYSDYTLDGGENYQEILLTYGNYGEVKNKKMRETGQYTGPHFDEDNIIAHIRTKDRMYGDKNVLYIEEIQSDWGQQGRKKGFDLEPEEKNELLKKVDDIKLELEKDINEYSIKQNGKQIPFADWFFKEKRAKASSDYRNDSRLNTNRKSFLELDDLDALQKEFYKQASDGFVFKDGVNVQQKDGLSTSNVFVTEGQIAQKYNQLTSAVNKVYGKKTPKAPFVTDTNKWTALALKRIISKASEEGYDAIAITPGKVHTDRWNTPGLANYYDNVIPKVANQVVGKLGGKVSKISSSELLDGPNQYEANLEAFNNATFIDLTPQVKDKAKKGQALFAVPVGASAVGVTKEQTSTSGDANEL